MRQTQTGATRSEIAAEIKLFVDNWALTGEGGKLARVYEAVMREVNHDQRRDRRIELRLPRFDRE